MYGAIKHKLARIGHISLRITKQKLSHKDEYIACTKCSQLIRRNFSTEKQTESQEIEYFSEEDYETFDQQKYILPERGRKVFILQPEIKWGPRKPKLTTAQLQLEEAVALIKTLPEWTVVGKLIKKQKKPDNKYVFSRGLFDEITREIRRTKDLSAVFVNMDILSTPQLKSLQDTWRVQVYDRYTVVLQIFKIHARTKEAKLQVALAEIPYFRTRLKGFHDGSLDQQRGVGAAIGGAGETFLETRKRLLQEKESKIKRALKDLRDQRNILRKNRIDKEFPVVAVVGYTNAGKTSLIKTLTGSTTLEPKNYLFATLDVTAHAGLLPNNTKVLYIDTVGFISDIPTTLIESFAATLEDALAADVILHVRDVSHPDTEAQHANVIQTLKALNISDDTHVIEVCNKVDLLSSSTVHTYGVAVSTITKYGMPDLLEALQEEVMVATGRIVRTVRVSMNGPLLSWLYKECSVVSCEEDPNDTEKLLVKVTFTPASLSKFNAKFTKGS